MNQPLPEVPAVARARRYLDTRGGVVTVCALCGADVREWAQPIHTTWHAREK